MNKSCRNQVVIALLILSFVQTTSPAPSQDDSYSKDLKRVPSTPNTRQTSSEQVSELSSRWLTLSEKSMELARRYEDQIAALLKAAEKYDVDGYRKLDDELAEMYEKEDANFLEFKMLTEAEAQSHKNGDDYSREAKKVLAEANDVIAVNLKRSKMFTYKSSAVFYQCFGLPLQALQSARLALNIAKSNESERDKVADISFDAGSAALWSGDYKAAAAYLEDAVKLDPKHQYATPSLADLYISEGNAAKAIPLLQSARTRATTDEVRGNLDRRLALAYTLEKKTQLAQTAITSAKKELDSSSPKVFTGIAEESSGVVSALSGDYRTAERKLSDALTKLRRSPIELGNRLEAAQTALWRSYSRAKLGDKVGALEDRKYALNISDEENHLRKLSRVLDPIFDFSLSQAPARQIRQRWALIVGVGDFADPKIPKLRYPVKDATDVRDFLVKNAGFEPDHVRLLLNSDATTSAITDSMAGKWLPSVVQPGDLVFLFVSSHGTPNYNDIGALNSLVAYDTKLDQLFSTSLPLQSIARMIRKRFKEQHTFVVMDTCYSGGLGAPGEGEQAKANANADPDLLLISNYQLLASSSDRDERSWESKRYANGIFTRQMLEVIEKNPRYSDFRTIFTQIADKVSEEVSSDYREKQSPKLSGLWSGKGLVESR